MPKSIHTRDQQRLMALLREARLMAGLTQAQLADKLGHNQTYVSKYEIGEKRLDLIELKAICKALRIGLVEFVERFARTPRTPRQRPTQGRPHPPARRPRPRPS